MLRLALGLFLVALLAGLFGFGLIESTFMEVARIVFFIFLVLAVLSLVGGAFRSPPA